MQFLRKVTRLCTAVAVLFSVLSFPTAHARSIGDDLQTLPGNYLGNFGGFYEQPHNYPHIAGAVVKTQAFVTAVDGLRNVAAGTRISGHRIMYTSTTSNGRIIPTTGALLEPRGSVKHAKSTPLIVFAPGTMGQGPQCASSKTISGLGSMSSSLDKRQGQGDQLFSLIVNYETPVVMKLLAEGFRVFVIDYLGGSSGPQAYVNNIEAGHAVLDAARAAVNAHFVDAHDPVAFWGYSQGGAASAMAGSLHQTYAPEVNLKAIYAGAPPLDLIEVNKTIDGTMIAAGALMGLNGYAARYPDVAQLVSQIMNEKGKKVLKRLANECLMDSILSTAYTQTKDLMKDGRPLYLHMKHTPLMQHYLTQQFAASRQPPTVPTLLLSNPEDDIVSYQQVNATQQVWCGRGAHVKFVKYVYHNGQPGSGMGHMMPGLAGTQVALEFVKNIFRGALLQRCETHVLT